MPTVDRKNTDTDEKHSLSSFDKRKVQSVTFGAKQLERKKYRVVKHEMLSPRAALKENVRCPVDNEVRAPLEHDEKVDTNITFKNNSAKSDSHNHTHHRSAENNADTSTSGISPEVAQRMQRAAYIQQMNNEKISQNIASANTVPDDKNVSTPIVENVERKVAQSCEKKDTSAVAEKRSEISEHKSSISPEMAQRMKRAIFLAQQNKEAIQLNRAAVVNDEAEVFHDSSENSSKNSAADIPKKTENPEHKPFDSRFLSLKSDKSDDMTASEKLKFKVNIAKAEFIEKFKDSINTNRRNDLGVRYLEEHRKEGYKYDTVSEAVNDGAAFNVTPDQIRELDGGGHTLMDKALKINDYSVYNPDNPEYHKGKAHVDGDYIGKAVQMGKTVQNSSSIGSAVTDVATTLAAVEAKKLVAKIMKGENAAKDRAFIEEHKAQGRTKYVDAEKERYKVEHKLSEKESVPDAMSREERRNFLHNKRVAEKQKSFYAERLQTERKNKQKEMFLDFNKDNPDLVSNTAKGTGKRYAKKKVAKALIGGGVLASIIPIIIVIIVFAVIAAFFGWLVPYSYSLAGEDGDETEAATNAEVIDGYAKLIKNYMDVTQAYYYLNYGDWYGGTYNYPSPDISFPEFFSEYCQSIVSEIQSYYYDLIAAAPNVNQKNALIDAMNNAISTAISNAIPAALAEYNALMASLDDTLTAETHRQHYETEQQSVPNNNADSAEFTGMPVVGTNHFGNVEINSELSAEELLAYIALYKSMSIINPDDSDPDAEQILNITPQDIMDFFEETEFITITTDVTHGNFCSGMNCKRRLVDEVWEYYCDGDHDNLTGEIGACKTADELREKVMELTDAESNGVDEDSFNKLIEEYMKLIEKELDITEADYRKFGAADNTKAQEYYQKLIDEGAIPNNFWNVETPIGEEDSDE